MQHAQAKLLAGSEMTEAGCRVWRRSLDFYGYGQVSYEGKGWKTHRLSYAAFVGPIPPGSMICHRCDNPACIEPSHLYAGSMRDNVRDMVERGRHSPGGSGKRVGCPISVRGETPSNRRQHAKLSPGDIDDIVAMHALGTMPVAAIAALYRVHRNHIYRILAGYRRPKSLADLF